MQVLEKKKLVFGDRHMARLAAAANRAASAAAALAASTVADSSEDESDSMSQPTVEMDDRIPSRSDGGGDGYSMLGGSLLGHGPEGGGALGRFTEVENADTFTQHHDRKTLNGGAVGVMELGYAVNQPPDAESSDLANVSSVAGPTLDERLASVLAVSQRRNGARDAPIAASGGESGPVMASEIAERLSQAAFGSVSEGLARPSMAAVAVLPEKGDDRGGGQARERLAGETRAQAFARKGLAGVSGLRKKLSERRAAGDHTKVGSLDD